MKLFDIIAESKNALLGNFGRSLLTSIGVMIGVAAIVALSATVGGIQNALVSEMGLNRSKLVYIMPLTSYGLTVDALESLEKSVPEYEEVSFQRMSFSTASTISESKRVDILGVEACFFDMEGIELASGYHFSDEENEGAERCVVVGPGIVDDFFGSKTANVVGEKIEIGGIDFTITGTIKAENQLNQYYGLAIIPEKTANYDLGMTDILYGVGYLHEDADNSVLTDSTYSFLEDYYNVGDAPTHFLLLLMEEAIEMLNLLTAGLGALLVIAASVSLVVGGIGIMNMMLTNVSERLKEIGIRRALGARKKDVFAQFLFESIAICAIGGVGGLVLGYAGSFGLASAVQAFVGIPVVPIFSLVIIVVVFVLCTLIGIIFGSYPAWRASNLEPVVALKS